MHEFFLQGGSLNLILYIVLSALATESLIMLVKDSDLSHWLIHPHILKRLEHNYIWYNYVLYKWITCGQCMSFIYSLPFSIIISYYSNPYLFLIYWLVIQRLSNWFSDLYKLVSRGRVTAIEFVNPLIQVSPSMSIDNLFEQSLNRLSNRGVVQEVRVHSLQDIIRIIKDLRVPPASGKTIIVNVDGKPVQIDTSSKHPSYLDIIKEHILNEQMFKQSEEDNQSIIINGEEVIPLSVSSNSSLDKFIEKCSGGTREENRIKWVLNDAIYYYDVINDKLTKSTK